MVAAMPKSSRDVIIRTDALADAEQFYSAVLGFAVSSRRPGMIGFETGSFTLYVEDGPEHGPVFDFLVADVEATKVRLLAAGCTLVEENRAVPRCYVRDPYGVTFNIGKSSGP
jgi:catechol 2,3-dioxygenase-like lactoylglutathione lyase family enzyme